MRSKPACVARPFAGVTAPTRATGTALACRTSVDQTPPALPGCVVAPTEITCTPDAGDPVVPSPGPEFPEAATTTQPNRAALLAAIASGLSGPPPPPRLMLMTLAIGFGNKGLFSVNGETASSIAMMMFEESQPPIGWTSLTVDLMSLQTLYDINFACGATPCRYGLPSSGCAR